MEHVSEKIICFMLRNEIIQKENKNVYLFGLMLMWRILVNVLTIFFLGIMFNMLAESIAFVLSSLLIRTYSGGYHADNPISCYFISVSATISMLFSIKFKIWNIYLAVILVIFSISIITKYAPVENKNKPLEKIERKIYRKRLLAIIYGLMFINFILISLNFLSIFFSISFTFGLSAVMILFCYSKNL